MQTGRLLKKSYQILRIDENEYPQVVYENLEKLKLYGQLRAEGCCEETALIAIKLKRAKFYHLKLGYEEDDGLQGLAPGSRRPHRVRQADERVE